MKSTFELLMTMSREELIAHTISLGLPPLEETAEAEAWARHIADGLQTHWENLLLMLRQEEVEALQAALAKGLQVPRTDADADGDLLCGLMTLDIYGLAEESRDCWELDPRLPGWLQLDAADMAQQHMQDLLYDYMQGWLLNVGMMPVEELTARAAALVEPDSQEEREDLQQLCHALLMARDGLDGMILDEYEEPWAVQAELEDAEALLERLRMPWLKALPWPEFDEDALVFSAQRTGLPGSLEIYGPLLSFLGAHEAEDDDLIRAAAMMIQNEQVDETVEMLAQECRLTSLRDIGQLTDLVFDLSNAMPRWFNKGHAPDALVKRQPARKAASPSRNEPCPCGSGRKYKQCCGRRVQ